MTLASSFYCLFDKQRGQKYKYVRLNQSVKNVKIKTKYKWNTDWDQLLDQLHDNKWLKSFAEPVAIITPINIMEVVIRPLSLCMRLFGNVLGAFVIMELLKIVAPAIIPIPFSFYFDIFDGFLQAYVFVFLTSLYIKEAIED